VSCFDSQLLLEQLQDVIEVFFNFVQLFVQALDCESMRSETI
jgi:hypothetical protein